MATCRDRRSRTGVLWAVARVPPSPRRGSLGDARVPFGPASPPRGPGVLCSAAACRAAATAIPVRRPPVPPRPTALRARRGGPALSAARSEEAPRAVAPRGDESAARTDRPRRSASARPGGSLAARPPQRLSPPMRSDYPARCTCTAIASASSQAAIRPSTNASSAPRRRRSAGSASVGQLSGTGQIGVGNVCGEPRRPPARAASQTIAVAPFGGPPAARPEGRGSGPGQIGGGDACGEPGDDHGPAQPDCRRSARRSAGSASVGTAQRDWSDRHRRRVR